MTEMEKNEMNQEAEQAEEVQIQSEEAVQEAEAEVEVQKDPLEEATEKFNQLKDQHLRLMAEFDNYRKRTTKEKEQSFERGQRNAVEAVLPVIDNLERALMSSKNEEDDPLLKGVQMTYDQLIKSLAQMGVEQLDDVGKTFDPNFHEAMMRVEDENAGEDEIVAVLRKGYTMNGTLLRASLVKVAN